MNVIIIYNQQLRTKTKKSQGIPFLADLSQHDVHCMHISIVVYINSTKNM